MSYLLSILQTESSPVPGIPAKAGFFPSRTGPVSIPVLITVILVDQTWVILPCLEPGGGVSSLQVVWTGLGETEEPL